MTVIKEQCVWCGQMVHEREIINSHCYLCRTSERDRNTFPVTGGTMTIESLERAEKACDELQSQKKTLLDQNARLIQQINDLTAALGRATRRLEYADEVVEAARKIRVAIPARPNDDFGLRAMAEAIAVYDGIRSGKTPHVTDEVVAEKKTLGYHVVQRNRINDFEECVSHLLKDGFELLGGVFVQCNDNGEARMYTQAMTYEKKTA